MKAVKSALWDEKDAERGVFAGLVVGTIVAALFTTSDYLALSFDYVRNQSPYGILWFWMNPNFWTDQWYRIYILIWSLTMELAMYWFGVRKGKLNKFLFYAGWLQTIIWMRGTVFQNVTVTTFAPLASINPFIIVPFILLQKLPIIWSFPDITANQHWWCAFVGNAGFTNGDTIFFPNGQKLISCPGGWLRWNPVYSWFWSYAMIAFWIVMPTLFYLKKRGTLAKMGKLGKSAFSTLLTYLRRKVLCDCDECKATKSWWREDVR